MGHLGQVDVHQPHSLHLSGVAVVGEAGRARHQRQAGRMAAESGLELDYVLGRIFVQS